MAKMAKHKWVGVGLGLGFLEERELWKVAKWLSKNKNCLVNRECVTDVVLSLDISGFLQLSTAYLCFLLCWVNAHWLLPCEVP